MKERLEIAEKVTLLFIPYLIVLSLAYYWGYWGYFGIDAISYYGVQDLIKGFTYALPAVLLLGIAFIISNAIMSKVMNALRKRFNKLVVFVVFLPVAGLVLWFALDRISTDTVLHWEIFWISVQTTSTALEALFSAVEDEWQWAKDNLRFLFIIKWTVIFCFVSFLSSYAYGANEARSIIENRNFSYMQIPTASDTAKSKSTFKYLGKAGDSHFFISPDNKEKRIVSAAIMQTLVLHNYDKNDSVSIRAYYSNLNHK